jgi:glycosyltransferase involved in cell wall biosynthesis
VIADELGVDIKSYETCVTEPEQFHTFAFLGRLGQRNGVYDLLKAIELLVFTYGKRNVKFLLAGDGEHDLVRPAGVELQGV